MVPGCAQDRGDARKPVPPANTASNATLAWSRSNRTVDGLTAVTATMWAMSAAQMHPGRAFCACTWVTTAAASAGVPSVNLTCGRSVNVQVLRSGDVLHPVASPVGAIRPLESKPTIGSYTASPTVRSAGCCIWPGTRLAMVDSSPNVNEPPADGVPIASGWFRSPDANNDVDVTL